MRKAFVLFANQLFKDIRAKAGEMIVLAEDPRFFSDFRFHNKKLIFHRASLKYYQKFLEDKNYRVLYLSHKELLIGGLCGMLSSKGIKEAVLYDPADSVLKERLEGEFRIAGIKYEFLESPLFLSPEKYLRDYFRDSRHYSMNSFYIFQRKHFDILIENGRPTGGKWSFDSENRLKLSKDIKVSQIKHPKRNKYVEEAAVYIQKNFADNPGSTEDFFYPVTHLDAEKWLEDFMENRLENFGPYEDAISAEHRYLFHSLLSPLLNSGLLTVEQVLKKVLSYSEKKEIGLNSLEGFIRQIIGWREFMRAVYILDGERQRASNFWRFTQKIPRQFYDGSTGIAPVDSIIKQALKNAYAHHIERLMVLGNFMLLCEIHPKEVYRWFMEMFIDSYDWVMVPNVFGMSQYSDGGTMTTKPYISSSNYLRKMSDFGNGDWCGIWDGLFWRFVFKYKEVFLKNPRMKIMAVYADKMDNKKRKEHIEKAEIYLAKLYG